MSINIGVPDIDRDSVPSIIKTMLPLAIVRSFKAAFMALKGLEVERSGNITRYKVRLTPALNEYKIPACTLAFISMKIRGNGN